MRTHTIALVLAHDAGGSVHVDTLCDDTEIEFLEAAIISGEKDPLAQVYLQRENQEKEATQFEDYIESLLSQPLVTSEIQENGVQWFKSKIKMEQFKKSEEAAAEIIAEYALRIYTGDPSRTDFTLMSSNSQVRVRIFTLFPSKFVSPLR